MTDLINAHQATPLTGRAYNVVLGHIRKDYKRIQANDPNDPPRVFHTVVKREGSRPKWWVSEADARAFADVKLPDKGGRPRKEAKRRGGAK